MKPCDFCGKGFTLKRRDGRFCSKDCYSSGHNEDARKRRRASAAVKPCDVCGKDFILTHHGMRFCSKDCRNQARNARRATPRSPAAKICGHCGTEFQTPPRGPDPLWCSQKCRWAARRARTPKVGRWTGPRPRTVQATCQLCGGQFCCTRRDAKLCSKCGSRTEKHLAGVHRRAVRLHAASVERVVRADIFARDNWICQLCGWFVLQEDTWPHPMSASLDHVVPLSRGGTHEPANVQLAHLRCNIRKGNKHALVA